jgi:hypothetical protein
MGSRAMRRRILTPANNDIKAISDGWLNAMVEHFQLENVGLVGAKLLYDDNTIQHAGVIIGSKVLQVFTQVLPDHSVGYFYRRWLFRNYRR